MALVGALCVATHTVAGFTNRSLRALVAGLLGASYGRSQMTYDLRRLRRHGLIERLPHTNTYVLRVVDSYVEDYVTGARIKEAA